MKRPVAVILAIAGISPLLLVGCDQETKDQPLPVRAIKHMTVSERASDQLRRIAGVVQAGTTTEIAFEIAGQVTKLPFGIGDQVTRGQAVGQLDRERYTLQRETSQGELQSAQAQRRDAEKKYAQQKELFDKGYATKTAFDSALATLESARSQVEIARSKVSIAERDVNKTTLLAPFSGRVSAKYVEVFTEVSAGQQILQLHSEGDQEVVASVPETLIESLSVGDPVDVRFTSTGETPGVSDKSTQGTIAEIGSQATAANAFQVVAKLDTQVPGIRPGMSAEITFRFETQATGRAFLLPTAAVLPDATARKGFVYTFDAGSGIVQKRKVSILNIRDNLLEVDGDLKAGDVIAVAGLSFLSDGMAVRLLNKAPGQ